VPINGQRNLLSIGHLLHPSDVEEIEVYNSIAVPAMFGTGFDPVCEVTAIRARRGM